MPLTDYENENEPEGTGGEAEDEAGFDSAFDEFVGETSGETDTGDAELPGEQVGEETPAGTEQQQDDTNQQTDQQAAQDDDINQLPDWAQQRVKDAEQRAQQWEHKHRSDAGRVSALQKQVNDLKQQSLQDQGFSSERIKEAMSSEEGWSDFKEEFPGVGEVLENQFEQIAQKMEERLKPIQDHVTQQAEDAYTKHQESALSLPKEQGGFGHSDWQDLAASQEFVDWAQQQHPAIQQLLDSNEAADAAYVLDLYKSTGRAANQQGQQGQAEQVRQRRQKNLQRNVHVEGQGASPAAGPPDDFDSAFDFYASKSEKKKQ